MKHLESIQGIVYAILGAILIVGVFFLWNSHSLLNAKLAKEKEAAKPAELRLTLIAPTDCEQCIDGNTLVQRIEREDVHITEADRFIVDSEEGKSLIAKYGIEKVPAVVVEGEYDKANISDILLSLGGEVRDGGLVIEVKRPVYVDLKTNTVTGLVDVTYLTDTSCEDCYDPAVQQKTILMNNYGVILQHETTLDAHSPEGQVLIQKYKIQQVPTMILSASAKDYTGLAKVWPTVGTIEPDGVLVFRDNAALGTATFLDLASGEIVRPTSTTSDVSNTRAGTSSTITTQ